VTRHPMWYGVTTETGLNYLGTLYLGVGFPLSTFTNPLLPSQSPDLSLPQTKAVTTRSSWVRRSSGGGVSILL
jgi:hypothetical protein